MRIHRKLLSLAAVATVAAAGTAYAAIPTAQQSSGSGGAKAYGYFKTDGTIDQSRSKNLSGAAVTKPSGSRGIYCFTGLAFTPKNVIVTLAAGAGQGTGAVAPTPVGLVGGAFCPPGTELTVAMADPSTGMFTRDHEFFLLVH